MSSLENLTWKCHGCGEERPDEWISVAKIRVELPITKHIVPVNQRYCNDRVFCLRKVADNLEEMARIIFNGEAPPASHKLAVGFPICGWLRGVPVQWPEGHTWERDMKDVTCYGCKAADDLERVKAGLEATKGPR